jgi:hypothetical protein
MWTEDDIGLKIIQILCITFDENIDLTSSFSNSNSMYWVEKMTFQKN